MSIITDQMPMANATLNARPIEGQMGPTWVQRNVTESQLRRSDQPQNLISGWWAGSIQGADRSPSMYPNNNMPLVALTVSSAGLETIKPSSNYVQG